MLIEREPARREIVTKIQCDKCGRVDDDVMEIQEYLRYGDTAGYGSRHIMDMTQWTIDLCQDCVHEVLNPYIKKVEPEVWEILPDETFAKLFEEEMRKLDEPPIPPIPLAPWAYKGIGSLPRADANGHRERYSDSSNFDGVCVLCGCKDNSHEMLGPCSNPFPDEVAETYEDWTTGPLSREFGARVKVWWTAPGVSVVQDAEIGDVSGNSLEGKEIRAWRFR